MAWFRKEKKPLKAEDRRELASDVFDKCEGCGEIVYREKLTQNLHVCPSCGHHFRVGPEVFVAILTDEGSFEETEAQMGSVDPLTFTDLKPYPARLRAAEQNTGHREAVVTGVATLEDMPIGLAVMNFRFIGGSMGSVVGEKILRIGLRSLDEERPLIIVSATGGARMQEGIYSLMQMAKVSAMLAQLHEAGVPYVSILTDPTTGGVTASFAMLGDVNIGEPGALIGLSGPRVIEETIKQELPEGFQRSEFLVDHGMLDLVVDRRQLRETTARLLRHMFAPAGGSTG
jgi:acetyl-CoA carboxylase carboxyl transferase subunit beta